MKFLSQREPTVNTIAFVKEGEHAGKLSINYQESLLSSKTIYAEAKSIMSIASLDNDDMGEEDVENNILAVLDFIDAATGEPGSGAQFILPADSYRDVNTLEWVLA